VKYDGFVLCFQYREDALRVQDVLRRRLGKFALTLEPTKTKLVKFGRFAQKHASKRGRKRPETIYFLGFTLYCTRNRKGNFRVGLRTEVTTGMCTYAFTGTDAAHAALADSGASGPPQSNASRSLCVLRTAGNIRALQKVHRGVERYWRRMLSNRSWKGEVWWKKFQQIKTRFPLL
jgi:hypothetical protein